MKTGSHHHHHQQRRMEPLKKRPCLAAAVPTQPRDLHLFDGVVSASLCEKALSYLEAIEDDLYHPLVHKRFGPSKRKGEVCYGRAGQDAIPVVLRAVGDEIRAFFGKLSHKCALGSFAQETLTVQRYKPGEGLGKHRDGPKVDPFVVGLTLCVAPSQDRRKLRFRAYGASYLRHDLVTAHGSVYTFHGDAYTNWTHESVASKRQKNNVYSLTFRNTTARVPSYIVNSRFSPYAPVSE